MTARINPESKTCNVCRHPKLLSEFYEGKGTCKSCERDRDTKSGKVDLNPLLKGWGR